MAPTQLAAANSLKSPVFAPRLTKEGVEFRLWAPLCDRVLLKTAGFGLTVMHADDDGWHRCDLTNVGAGVLYSFVLPDGVEVPDPASRFQPCGVHGPSEVVDLGAYHWQAADWQGKPWHEMVLYEMHIGGFTQEGTFLAAIERLDELQSLGITGIQIMPVADFPGDYNWGYDGVLPYAPARSYGRPEDLMALVDAAHLRGMNVFLDVVYNHFGPEGNYLPLYTPLFTNKHETPWGKAINYEGENSRWVREFVIQNALYWIRNYRFDGLRLDAVHAIQDDSPEHLVHELTRRVKSEVPARNVHVIVENEENDSDLLHGSAVTAQWNDDLHHVLHVAATGADFGYYRDYTNRHSEKLVRALAESFVFQGEEMSYSGKRRGKPSAHLAPTSFISFIQNHDQIGNRARGDRMVTYRSEEELRAIAAIYLLAPQIPMLFMGEEWGAPEPFPFFCNFTGELGEMVRQGRRREFARVPGFEAKDLPDPTEFSTFRSAKLDWNRRALGPNAAMLDYYNSLVRTRHDYIVPLLPRLAGGNGIAHAHEEAIEVEWKTSDTSLYLRANLSTDHVTHLDQSDGAHEIFSTGSHRGEELGPWTVVWSIGAVAKAEH